MQKKACMCYYSPKVESLEHLNNKANLLRLLFTPKRSSTDLISQLNLKQNLL